MLPPEKITIPIPDLVLVIGVADELHIGVDVAAILHRAEAPFDEKRVHLVVCVQADEILRSQLLQGGPDAHVPRHRQAPVFLAQQVDRQAPDRFLHVARRSVVHDDHLDVRIDLVQRTLYRRSHPSLVVVERDHERHHTPALTEDVLMVAVQLAPEQPFLALRLGVAAHGARAVDEKRLGDAAGACAQFGGGEPKLPILP